MSAFGRIHPEQQVRWLDFRNATLETIPGFAVMRVAGVEERQGGLDDVIVVAKPEDGDHCHVVNGPLPIQTGRCGKCTYDFPAYVLWDGQDEGQTGATSESMPANGETWGPISGSWKIVKQREGFRIWGNAYKSTSGSDLVYVSSDGCFDNGGDGTGGTNTGGTPDTGGTGLTQGTGTQGTGLTQGSGLTGGTAFPGNCPNCPANVVEDTFTDNPGPVLDGRSPEEGVAPWEADETLEIIANQVRQAGGDGVQLGVVEGCYPDVRVTVRLRVSVFGDAALHSMGMIGRYVDHNNYWLVAIDSGVGGIFIQKVEGGVFSTEAFTPIQPPGTSQVGFNDYTTMTFLMIGNDISAQITVPSGFYTVGPVTNTFNNTATKAGFFGYGPYGGTYNFDNFNIECF